MCLLLGVVFQQRHWESDTQETPLGLESRRKTLLIIIERTLDVFPKEVRTQDLGEWEALKERVTKN